MKGENKKKSIYHYTNLEGLNGILSKSVIWLTHYNFLNDPYEFKCQHLTTKKDLSLKLLELMPDSFMPFIISFSKDSDSYPLWSNYTKFYGFNIEFDIQKLVSNLKIYLENNQNDSFPNFFRNDIMNYSNDDQKGLIEKLINSNNPYWKKVLDDLIKNHLEFQNKSVNDVIAIISYNNKYIEEIVGHPIFTILFKNMSEFFNNMIFFKPSTLKTEEEYRFTFIYHAKNVNKFIKFRQKNNLLLPYIEIPINFKDESLNPIISVTLGPKNKSDLNRKCIELFKSSRNIDFDIYDSKINLR